MSKQTFINDKFIHLLIERAANATEHEIQAILEKAKSFKGLTPEEAAALLCTNNPEHLRQIYSIAGSIKEEIYGDRVVMFAPLYVSDYCVNQCSYCGFSHKFGFGRKRLSMDALREEVRILEKMGHKRLALEAGEDPINCPIEYILECLKTIYDTKLIRRVNVNIAATTVENYKKLKEAGIGTYILFQETYHQETYEGIHTAGPKKNYDYHTTAFDRALEAGLDDVGAGVLFGLYDYRYEVLGLMLHNAHLEQRFGVGFHTISVPRVCPITPDETVSQTYTHVVDDETFKKIVAVIRLAVPFTGMIMSTRESADMRRDCIALGISQISGGSTVEVGGYALGMDSASQFELADNRSAKDIIFWLMEEGLLPSFCTACYRTGRTGDRFMSLAKTGNIKNVCLPNALLTLKEYALDYGDEDFRRLAEGLINKKIKHIENETVRDLIIENLRQLEAGERDLFI